jgi:hypothetical protein
LWLFWRSRTYAVCARSDKSLWTTNHFGLENAVENCKMPWVRAPGSKLTAIGFSPVFDEGSEGKHSGNKQRTASSPGLCLVDATSIRTSSGIMTHFVHTLLHVVPRNSQGSLLFNAHVRQGAIDFTASHIEPLLDEASHALILYSSCTAMFEKGICSSLHDTYMPLTLFVFAWK